MLNPHRGIRFLDLKIAVYRIVNIKHATVLFHPSKKKKHSNFSFFCSNLSHVYMWVHVCVLV